MSILQNAVMAIQIGLVDMQDGSQARILSSVRNITAGVLLLLKARLQQLSPAGSDEVLLKTRIRPRIDSTGRLEWIGSGKKTVDVVEIQTRLSGMGVDVDWARVTKLTEERNNIEHYYTNVSIDALRGLVADVLVIVRDFVSRELEKDPRELFGTQAWDQLLKNAQVYEAERRECLAKLAELELGSKAAATALRDFPCSDCGSALIRPTDTEVPIDRMLFECRSCGAEIDAQETIAEALKHHYSLDASIAHQDQMDGPLVECPDCARNSYVREEDVCACCGYEREYSECYRCGSDLPIDEQDLGGLCSYCEHMSGKDD